LRLANAPPQCDRDHASRVTGLSEAQIVLELAQFVTHLLMGTNKRELRERKGKRLSILRKERDEQEDTKEEDKYNAARDDEKVKREKN